MDTTKAKPSHDSTKGLAELPKTKARQLPAPALLYTLAKEKGKKAPKTLILSILTITLPFCYRAEDLRVVFHLVF